MSKLRNGKGRYSMKPALLPFFVEEIFSQNSRKQRKSVDNFFENRYNIDTMQVSPSGMAAASQAVPGEFDSRHLLQKDKRPLWGVFLFCIR